MSILKLFIILLAGCCATTLYSQSSYNTGLLPEFTVGKKLSPVWSLDMELAPRFEVSEGKFGDDSESEIYFSLLDVTTITTRTIGVDNKLGFGYLARFRNHQVIHRLIQQYSLVVPKFGYRLAHRFRVDETFALDEKLRVRLRYRLSSDISINGEFIDPKEVYIKLGNEYVTSFQGNETDLEIRIVPALGYYFNDHNKLEIGLDYRIDSFIDSTANHRFWINVGYYLSL